MHSHLVYLRPPHLNSLAGYPKSDHPGFPEKVARYIWTGGQDRKEAPLGAASPDRFKEDIQIALDQPTREPTRRSLGKTKLDSRYPRNLRSKHRGGPIL